MLDLCISLCMCVCLSAVSMSKLLSCFLAYLRHISVQISYPGTSLREVENKRFHLTCTWLVVEKCRSRALFLKGLISPFYGVAVPELTNLTLLSPRHSHVCFWCLKASLYGWKCVASVQNTAATFYWTKFGNLFFLKLKKLIKQIS